MLFWIALLRALEVLGGASLRQQFQVVLRWIPEPPALLKISVTLQKWLQDTERTSWRARRWVPGAACRHQALALRIAFALRGIPSQVKVAMKTEMISGKRCWRGHAWLEVFSESEAPLVLLEVLEGASIVLNEGQLIGSKIANPNQ